MSDFLSDYLFYNSGNEADRTYHLWSALFLLSTVVGRRVIFREEGEDTYHQLVLRPNILACLVGAQGNGKSFAKDGVRDILQKEFPHIPITPNTDTVQAITKRMGQPDHRRVMIINGQPLSKNGAVIEYTPLAMIINELKNYISVNPAGMVDFIVDISDREDFYDVNTKNKGDDKVIAPYVTFLACATTEYIIDQLRDKILSGGLSRRVVFINVTKERERKLRNVIPPGGKDALARCIQHLHKIEDTVAGDFRWASEEDWRYAAEWYIKTNPPQDPLMAGFARTKKQQALKIAMLLALAEYQPQLLLTRQHFGKALLFLQELEPNMERLFMSAGRNTLSVPMQHILDMLNANGGMMPEKEVRRLAGKDLEPHQLINVLDHLKSTEEIIVVKLPDANGVARWTIFTKKKYEELTKK